MTTRRLIGFACLLHLECSSGFTSPLGSRGAAFVSSYHHSSSKLHSSENFYNDFEESGNDDDDDEDDDGYIDTEELGDWRKFRMNLAETGTPSDKKTTEAPRKSVSKENEEVLRSQSNFLADEYETGMWAHEAPKVCVYTVAALFKCMNKVH